MRNVYLVHDTSTEHYDKGFSYPGHNPFRLFMSCLSTEVVPSSGFYDTRCLYELCDRRSIRSYTKQEGICKQWFIVKAPCPKKGH